MLLADTQIRELCVPNTRGFFQCMITPYVGDQIRYHGEQKVISYGQSSYGYDVRLAGEFKKFTNIRPTSVVDPKNFNSEVFVEESGERCIIPPNSFVLGRTIEYFNIPDNILVLCIGKSTYARCGIILNVTPLEPGWCGHVTMEISNTTPLPAIVYAGEGIGQMLFLKGERRCLLSYADRAGKYQGQEGITLPKL